MIDFAKDILLKPSELKFSFVTSQGPGGQNVNKVATTAILRFNVLHSSSLPEDVRLYLISLLGKKLTSQGDFIIKAGRYRTQERNKQDAIERLYHLIKRAVAPPKKRKKTKPTFGSTQRRLNTKKKQGNKKAMRRLDGEINNERS